MAYDQLKLSNQICFPVYAASRLITREYQPHLEQLGLTYPQYLVLLVLWEQDHMAVNDIAKKLILNTNTITPLLKRMQVQGLIMRNRSTEDERKVVVSLTAKGKNLQQTAAAIPQKLTADILKGPVPIEDIAVLKEKLYQLIDFLSQKES